MERRERVLGSFQSFIEGCRMSDFMDAVGMTLFTKMLREVGGSAYDEYQSDPDGFFMRMAYRYAAKNSQDPSTQNGAIIVLSNGIPVSLGANRLPPGVESRPERLERPAKYSWLEHAEKDAVISAREPLDGATLYCPWSACAECARAIILSGIKELVGHQECCDKTPERWRESIQVANQMLDEAGVKRRMISGKIGGCRVLFDGQWWEP